MARVCWWFYFSKVLELSDTVSMKDVKRSCGEHCYSMSSIFMYYILLYVCLCLRLRGSGIFHPEKEEQSADLSPCLPPRHHDLQLVGWG